MADFDPQQLPEFEDRVLYWLVELTGNKSVEMGRGVTEAAIAERLRDELGVTAASIRGDDFHGSHARGQVLTAVSELEDIGLVEAIKVSGPWTIRPTLSGRRQVNEWRQSARTAPPGSPVVEITTVLQAYDDARAVFVAYPWGLYPDRETWP